MIEKIIEFSEKHKFFVITLTIAALISEAWCFKNIRLDAIPDLSDTQNGTEALILLKIR